MFSTIIINKHQNFLFTFVPDNQFGQLISIAFSIINNVETTNVEFSLIEVWFTDQNDRPLSNRSNRRFNWNKMAHQITSPNKSKSKKRKRRR